MPAAQLLEQIREAWSASGNNELIIKRRKKACEPARMPRNRNKEKPNRQPSQSPIAPRQPSFLRDEFGAIGSAGIVAVAVESQRAGDQCRPGKARRQCGGSTDQPAPITINITDDGRLMISSRDPVALDRMEELIGQLTPPERRFKVYELNYIPASHMYWDLHRLI